LAQAYIELEIVTPDGIKLNERVSELTAPSVDGEFGVLPGHRPLLAALKTGIVSYKIDREEHHVAVGSGFVEVADDKARLLTDRFIRKPDVDPVRARLDLKDADVALDEFTGDPSSNDYAELVKKELWAAAQLELYGDPPPATVRTVHEFQLAPAPSFTGEAAPISDERAEASDRRPPE
jgi:F-type H+-transporting ATPase subunit epsilon